MHPELHLQLLIVLKRLGKHIFTNAASRPNTAAFKKKGIGYIMANAIARPRLVLEYHKNLLRRVKELRRSL
jgi:hypothetical protein